jgi:hypothetical protein
LPTSLAISTSRKQNSDASRPLDPTKLRCKLRSGIFGATRPGMIRSPTRKSIYSWSLIGDGAPAHVFLF